MVVPAAQILMLLFVKVSSLVGLSFASTGMVFSVAPDFTETASSLATARTMYVALTSMSAPPAVPVTAAGVMTLLTALLAKFAVPSG